MAEDVTTWNRLLAPGLAYRTRRPVSCKRETGSLTSTYPCPERNGIVTVKTAP